MEYEIQSKPTIYNGTKYRSRLEARWAAFFDLIGWRYQYEPFDLTGWTPDFVIYGSKNRMLFIEVKPVVTREFAKEYCLKLQHIRPSVNAIMISPDFIEDGFGGPILAGYQISEKEPDVDSTNPYWYVPDPFPVHWKNGQTGINSEYDIGSEEMAYDGMLWHSESTRKNFLTHFRDDFTTFQSKWVEAGERTRFHYRA